MLNLTLPLRNPGREQRARPRSDVTSDTPPSSSETVAEPLTARTMTVLSETPKDKDKIVVGVDFGTTYSGYVLFFLSSFLPFTLYT